LFFLIFQVNGQGRKSSQFQKHWLDNHVKHLLVIFMFYFHYLFSGLIFNSNIQLEVYNFFYLNQFSFIAYFILAILLASLVIFTDKVVFLASTLVGLKSFI
jgi:hypothetical protein